jgi:WD40 repeat protein
MASLMFEEETPFSLEPKILQGHNGPVNSVSFNSTGNLIVSGSKDIRIWDVETGEYSMGPAIELTDQVLSIAFNPAGDRIVFGTYGDTIQIWDVRSIQTILQLSFNRNLEYGYSGPVHSVAFNSSGTKIVSGSYDHTVRIWDVETGECESMLRGHTRRVHSVAFNPSGSKIVSGSEDTSIKIWNVATGRCESTLKGHLFRVYYVAFNSSGTKIVSGSGDKTIRIWDLELLNDDGVLEGHDGTVVLEGHTSPVNSVAFNPAGDLIVSGSDDHTVRIWDVESRACKLILNSNSDTNSVAFNSSGSRIVAGFDNSTIQIYDVDLKMNYSFLNEYEVDDVEFRAFRNEDYIKVEATKEGCPLLLNITVFKTGKYRVDFPMHSSEYREENENFLRYMIGDNACDRVIGQGHANFAELVADMFLSAAEKEIVRLGKRKRLYLLLF